MVWIDMKTVRMKVKKQMKHESHYNPHHSASHSQPTHTPPFICVVRREAHDGAWPVRTVGTHSVTYVPVARYTCRSRGHA